MMLRITKAMPRGWQNIGWFALAVAAWALLMLLHMPLAVAAQSGTIPPASGTAPFYELSTTLPNDDESRTVAAGDLNGDGALDLVMGNKSGAIFYLNDGQGNFDAGTLLGAAAEIFSVALADMDDDGALDIIVDGPQAAILFNDGGAHFPRQQPLTMSNLHTKLLVGDIDGDRDFDLVAGRESWRNDGNGHLTADAALPAAAIELVDFDRDGDLDLVAERLTGATFTFDMALYINNGAGAFTQIGAILTPPLDLTSAVATGDLDGDGQLDLVIARSPSSMVSGYMAETLVLYRQRITAAGLPDGAPQILNEIDGAVSIQIDDIDLDGDLDIVTTGLGGVNPGRVEDGQGYIFLNEGVDEANMLQFTRTPWGAANLGGHATLADLDGDGVNEIVAAKDHFDLIYTNYKQPNFDTCDVLPIYDASALIDLAGDGDLDVLYYNFLTPTTQLQAAINDGAGNFQYGMDTGLPTATNLTTADLNADSLDDVIIGGSDLFMQGANGQFTAYGTLGDTSANATSLATGDIDGDGDIDLILGRPIYDDADSKLIPGQNQIYLNQGDGHFDAAISFGAADEDTASLALADLDNDGNLDIVVGNGIYRSPELPGLQQSMIYWNRGNWNVADAAHFDASPLGNASGNRAQMVVGDFNGDGFTDIVAVDSQQSERLFLNRGNRTFDQQWLITSGEQVYGLFALDLDMDGDLDLLSGGSALRNNGQGVFTRRLELVRASQEADSDFVAPQLVGDLNGDSLVDVIGAHVYPISIFNPLCLSLHNGAVTQRQPAPPAQIKLLPLANTVLDGPYASPHIFDAGAIIFDYTLFDPTGRLADVRGFYSLDGGGQWRPATATPTTLQTGLATRTSNGPIRHTYTWDVLGSGFFGQSDRVVFRLEARPNVRPQPNAVAGPYRTPYRAAQSYPFRVRGTQVHVVDVAGAPVPDAILYRLPADATGAATPFAATAESQPFSTNSQGYLSGSAELNTGDRLAALAPITATESYTLYNMSAAPTLTGLAVFTVTTPGVQELTVSPANPLLLFNLDVSLEWDARKDAAFLAQLDFDLKRTSEILFDATDGQAALGEIRLYHNKERWERADVRIYASNALIPNADPGGIVLDKTSEVIASNPFINAPAPYAISYQPGNIRIGAVWNRFGEANGTLGEDWPRTLAHEIGHYAFYLYDNYLGLQDGVVAPVTSCTGTLMTDQYRDDFSEFRTAANWAADCGQTISAQRSGRADWQTITRFYPWLKAPAGPPNPGPVTLPLAVTQIDSRLATTLTEPLDVAVFDLVDVNGAAQLSSERAQAVLYTSDGRLIDLGHPVVDAVEARGAHVGDRLCVYDPLVQRLGCETIAPNDNYLALVDRPGWQPEIVVSPVTSRTVTVLVSNVALGLELRGQLYPENSAATAVNAFVQSGDSYSTTFQLADGVLAGHIQVWVNEADSALSPRHESLTSYALGGSPGKRRKPLKGGVAAAEAADTTAVGAGNESITPAIAPDGQVLIYGNVTFDNGEFYALQKVQRLPTPPAWTTLVGDGYRILKSANAPALVDTSILFRYRGQDAPAGEENFLSLYFWNADAQQWEKLATTLNQAVNEASAPARGPGLYVLMSSLEIPLYQVGWNLISYPVQETRAVSEALASISDGYNTVYAYQTTDTLDPWKLYAPTAPSWVNDLTHMVFGQGYWIHATEAMTWLIKGPENQQVQSAAANSLPMPPATYYGVVLSGNGLTPAAGAPVQALINGVVCGQSLTRLIGGQIVYAIDVEGDGRTNPACIGAGRQVELQIEGGRSVTLPWQNDAVQGASLNGKPYFLPVIARQ